MWKSVLIISVLLGGAFGLSTLPLGTECTLCQRPTSFQDATEVSIRLENGQDVENATFHRDCHEVPKQLEQKITDLKDALRTDMSQSSGEEIYRQLEETSLRIIRLKELGQTCAAEADCGEYDALLETALD